MPLSEQDLLHILQIGPEEVSPRIKNKFRVALVSSGAGNKVNGQKEALGKRGIGNVVSLDTGASGFEEPEQGSPRFLAGLKTQASKVQLGYLEPGAFDIQVLDFPVEKRKEKRKSVLNSKDKIALLITSMDVETSGAKCLAAFGQGLVKVLSRLGLEDYQVPHAKNKRDLQVQVFHRLGRQIDKVRGKKQKERIIKRDLAEKVDFFTQSHVIRFRVGNVVESTEAQSGKRVKKAKNSSTVSKYSEIDYYVGFKGVLKERVQKAYEDIDQVSKDASRIGLAQSLSIESTEIDWVLVCDSDKPEEAVLLPPEFYHLVTRAVVAATPPDAVMNDLLIEGPKPKNNSQEIWNRSRVRLLRSRSNN